MPISSGAGGHVGVGVDTSIKWVPDGGIDFQSPRDVNSYLQRYLDSHPKVGRRLDEGSWQDCEPEEQLEIQDSQVITNENNSTKDVKTPKRKNEVHDGPAAVKKSDIKSQKLNNGLHEDPAPTRISGPDGKTPKLKNEDDSTNTHKTESKALQQNNQKQQKKELQPEGTANNLNNADSVSVARAETAQQGKGTKPAAKSSTCTVL